MAMRCIGGWDTVKSRNQLYTLNDEVWSDGIGFGRWREEIKKWSVKKYTEIGTQLGWESANMNFAHYPRGLWARENKRKTESRWWIMTPKETWLHEDGKHGILEILCVKLECLKTPANQHMRLKGRFILNIILYLLLNSLRNLAVSPQMPQLSVQIDDGL